jgi:hypothetical protein
MGQRINISGRTIRQHRRDGWSKGIDHGKVRASCGDSVCRVCHGTTTP